MNFLDNLTSSYENVWKSVVQPPRLEYEMRDLGQQAMFVSGVMVVRKDVQLLNSRGETLECSYFSPASISSRQLQYVVYLQGIQSSRVEAVSVISSVCPSFGLICFDYAGSGKSGGEYVTMGVRESEDMECVVRYMRLHLSDRDPIVWGRSIGAVIAILYDSRLNKQQQRLGGMILDSAFSDLKQAMIEIASTKVSLPEILLNSVITLAKQKIEEVLGINIFEMNLLDKVEKLFCPVLFAYAADDKYISPRHTNLLYEACSARNKQLIEFQGNHNTPRPAEYLSKVKIFFASLSKQNEQRIDSLMLLKNQPLVSSFAAGNPYDEGWKLEKESYISLKKISPKIVSTIQSRKQSQPINNVCKIQTLNDGDNHLFPTTVTAFVNSSLKQQPQQTSSEYYQTLSTLNNSQQYQQSNESTKQRFTMQQADSVAITIARYGSLQKNQRAKIFQGSQLKIKTEKGEFQVDHHPDAFNELSPAKTPIVKWSTCENKHISPKEDSARTMIWQSNSPSQQMQAQKRDSQRQDPYSLVRSNQGSPSNKFEVKASRLDQHPLSICNHASFLVNTHTKGLISCGGVNEQSNTAEKYPIRSVRWQSNQPLSLNRPGSEKKVVRFQDTSKESMNHFIKSEKIPPVIVERDENNQQKGRYPEGIREVTLLKEQSLTEIVSPTPQVRIKLSFVQQQQHVLAHGKAWESKQLHQTNSQKIEASIGPSLFERVTADLSSITQSKKIREAELRVNHSILLDGQLSASPGRLTVRSMFTHQPIFQQQPQYQKYYSDHKQNAYSD